MQIDEKKLLLEAFAGFVASLKADRAAQLEPPDAAMLKEIEESPADARALAAEMFARIMVWTWGGRERYPKTRVALVRFCALSSGLRPDLVDDMTFAQIARSIGVTKQSLSKAALLFQKAFGVKFTRTHKPKAQ